MKTLSKIIFTTAIVLCMAFYSNAQTSMDYNILIEDIEFQPGVFIDINVNVYVNENATNWANHGKIFAVEGMAHTAYCMQPLAEELFLNPPQVEINEFYAIDMPGRGGSGLPEGGDFLLEDMYLEDYLAVIQGTLDYLNNELNVYPATIMGHSLGGAEVILLQDKLISEGTNLRKEYKIKNAVLLAPAIPAPLDWAYISGGGSSGLYEYIDYFTPEYGTVLNLPFYAWPYAFFTNTCCYFFPDMVPGAPTPAVVLANGYNSIEPAPLLLQLSGAEIPPGLPYPYKPRPGVDEGIFKPKNGVQLTIISDEYDKMMTPAEEIILYEYLTGDQNYMRFFEVLGEETCHDTHISDPHAVVELLDKPYIFKSSDVDEDITFTHNVKVYPNPVQSNSTIEVELDINANLELCIYNQIGLLIETIYNGQMEKGIHTFQMTTEKLSVGLYTLRVHSSDKSEVIKVIKTK